MNPSSRTLRWSLGGVALLLGASSLIAFHGEAAQPWQLQDLRSALTSRAGSSLTISGRGQDWLATDGARLWSIGSTGEVTDYSDKARGSGPIAGIGSDGQNYLIAWNEGTQHTFTTTNLTNWTPVQNVRINDRKLQSINGKDGRWVVQTAERLQNGSMPRTQSFATWSGNTTLETLPLPQGASGFVSGCFKELSPATVCSGVSALVPLRNEWYLFAGESETRSANGDTYDEASINIWRWMGGSTFEPVARAPKARFVSGVWGGDEQILFATTDAVTNPYAADTYWTFDGRSFRAHQDAPLAAGLLSVDTRAVDAAWNGTGWTITAGKQLIRFERGFFQVEGTLRDLPRKLAGSRTGATLIAGTEGSFDTAQAPTSVNPSLLLVNTQVTNDQSNALLRPLGSPPPNSLTTFTLNATPGTAIIKNSSPFTFRAAAQDEDGIERVEIFVHGAKVSSCQSDICSYTQTYWTTQPTSTETLFFARAIDRRGNVADSRLLRLTVTSEPGPASIAPVSSDQGRMPPGLRWNTDARTQIGSTTWTTPSSTPQAFYGTDLRLYSVAAQHAGGIESIEIWVNGNIEQTCQEEEGGLSFCQAPLLGRNYPLGSEVFMNARILAKNGRETWTSATRWQRQ